jgi:5-oxoprolinase (ATP-hydrolysing) subunit A
MLINADVGESFGCWQMGQDALLMPWLDQASIACGFHAGDPSVMVKTVQLALEHRVEMGAHPSYPDLQGFGRRSMAMKPEEVTALIRYQVGALQAIAEAEGGQLGYVKPHGALYNDMMQNEQLMLAVMNAVVGLNRSRSQPLHLMLLAQMENTQVQQLAEARGLPLYFEAFADRGYQVDGWLIPRGQPGALLQTEAEVQQQANRLLRGDPVQADSLCLHGDHPQALAFAEALFQAVKHHAL